MEKKDRLLAICMGAVITALAVFGILNEYKFALIAAIILVIYWVAMEILCRWYKGT